MRLGGIRRLKRKVALFSALNLLKNKGIAKMLAQQFILRFARFYPV